MQGAQAASSASGSFGTKHPLRSCCAAGRCFCRTKRKTFRFRDGRRLVMQHLSSSIYRDDRVAREYLEALRWPKGPVCPHCGAFDNAAPMHGKSTRVGVWKCRRCRKPFSVTVGTEFERARIPLSKMLLADYLLTSSRRCVSVRQLQLRLSINYKSALLMARRIRAGGPLHRLLVTTYP